MPNKMLLYMIALYRLPAILVLMNVHVMQSAYISRMPLSAAQVTWSSMQAHTKHGGVLCRLRHGDYTNDVQMKYHLAFSGAIHHPWLPVSNCMGNRYIVFDHCDNGMADHGLKNLIPFCHGFYSVLHDLYYCDAQLFLQGVAKVVKFHNFSYL